ncbi:MAG: 50S ribosomal protein L9 [Candidatus Zambryskibacteria bacterium]|nr:50S ribosomal protein L9 [Candidatus Zambryskibacteria bacterium]
MKVILLKDVKGVGRRFDEKSVSDGYAANFLIPRNLALMADKTGLAKVKQLKAQGESKRTLEEHGLAEKEAKRFQKHLELERFRAQQRGEPSS